MRAVATGLTAADIAQLFPGSRRMAEKRFRSATGTSIGDAILDARFEMVLSLLRHKDIRLEAIADLTGWKSAAALRQYFKRRAGVPMRKHRKLCVARRRQSLGKFGGRRKAESGRLRGAVRGVFNQKEFALRTRDRAQRRRRSSTNGRSYGPSRRCGHARRRACWRQTSSRCKPHSR